MTVVSALGECALGASPYTLLLAPPSLSPVGVPGGAPPGESLGGGVGGESKAGVDDGLAAHRVNPKSQYEL